MKYVLLEVHYSFAFSDRPSYLIWSAGDLVTNGLRAPIVVAGPGTWREMRAELRKRKTLTATEGPNGQPV